MTIQVEIKSEADFIKAFSSLWGSEPGNLESAVENFYKYYGQSVAMDHEYMNKRLLGAMSIGVRIEVGVEFIYTTFDLNADEIPSALHDSLFSSLGNDPNFDKFVIKDYGSVYTALNEVDSMLESLGLDNLVKVYDNKFNTETVWKPI